MEFVSECKHISILSSGDAIRNALNLVKQTNIPELSSDNLDVAKHANFVLTPVCRREYHFFVRGSKDA
jgi:hypothetical protein